MSWDPEKIRARWAELKAQYPDEDDLKAHYQKGRDEGIYSRDDYDKALLEYRVHMISIPLLGPD